MLRCLATRMRAVLMGMFLWLFCAGAAHGYIIINAPMTDTNSSGWVLGGNPTSALQTGNGAIDPVGSGWLRLTNNSGDQTGFAYNTTTFDLSAGALIQFDYVSWGGSGADGFSVFLFDANVPTFNIGAFGGSLGYAQKLTPAVPTNVPGISGGYMGVGIDEFGNFANPTEGRYLGPGARPNTVTVRGSVVGFGGGAVGSTVGATSYPWIATSANNGLLWVNSGTRPVQTSTDYRKVIIQISPAPNPVVNAWVQFGYNTTPVQMITNQALPAIPASQQLRVGFGASTGGSTNYHELRNLLITDQYTATSIDLGVTKTAVTTGTSTPITSVLVGGSYQYLVTALNYGPNSITATGVGITDTFPGTITPGAWACTASGGATCVTATGTGNLTAPTATANLPKGGSVTYRVNATVNAMPAGNLISNTARLTIPGAVTDYYSNNDSATATINAYSPPTVTKTFSPAAILPGGTSTVTITLTNPNNIPATAVTLTDTYPTTPGAMVNAATTNRVTTCGGTSSGVAGGANVRLTNAANSIPAKGSCTLKIDVTAPTAGSYTNSTGTIATTNIGNGTAATGTLVVLAPPTVTKSFAVGSMAVGGTTPTLRLLSAKPTPAPLHSPVP